MVCYMTTSTRTILTFDHFQFFFKSGFIELTEWERSHVLQVIHSFPFKGILSSIPEFFIHIRENFDALQELERVEKEQDAIKKLSELADGIEYDEHLHSRHRQKPKDLSTMRIGNYLSLDGSLSIARCEFGYDLMETEIRICSV
jgi:hypothetical protein